MSTNTSNFKIEPVPLLRKWRNIGIVLLAIGFTVLFSPVLIPYSLLNSWSHRRQIRRAALAFRCPACGRVAGDAGLGLAKTRWQAQLEDYGRRNPGLKFNFIRHYDVVCTGCNTHYVFTPQNRSFEAVSAAPL